MMCGYMGTLATVVAIASFGIISNNCINVDKHTVKRIYGISHEECMKVCDKIPDCSQSKYTRRFHICELFENTFTTSTMIPGTFSYLKHVDNLPSECEKCSSFDECDIDGKSEVCKVIGCGQPLVLQGVKTLGNIYDIGSKIKYQCFPETGTISCLANGTWSQIDLSCSCKYPAIPNGEIRVTRLNDGLFEANVVNCAYGYALRHAAQPLTCDPSTGIWTGNENVYCDKMVDGPWRKIFTLPKENKVGLVNRWKKGIVSNARYAYRNDSFIDNWENMPVRDVKVSVVKDDKEEAFVIFDGRKSTKYTWFSKQRLLQSSWADLDRNGHAYFNWEGIARKRSVTVNARYFIYNTFDHNECEGDVGWFVMNWDYYPCDFEGAHATRILYSKGSKASKFLINETGFADKLEVWVN